MSGDSIIMSRKSKLSAEQRVKRCSPNRSVGSGMRSHSFKIIFFILVNIFGGPIKGSYCVFFFKAFMMFMLC